MGPARALVIVGAGIASSCATFPTPARVTLTTSVTGADCDQNDPSFLTVGSFVQRDGYETTEEVVHEHMEGDQTTTVECKSVASDGGYKVKTSVQVVGPDTSRFVMSGKLVADPVAQPVAEQFSAHSFFYKPRNCVLTYETPQQTVAPGAVWAHVSCPNSLSADAAKRINGKPVACDIVTTMRFEECAR